MCKEKSYFWLSSTLRAFRVRTSGGRIASYGSSFSCIVEALSRLKCSTFLKQQQVLMHSACDRGVGSEEKNEHVMIYGTLKGAFTAERKRMEKFISATL